MEKQVIGLDQEWPPTIILMILRFRTTNLIICFRIFFRQNFVAFVGRGG
jgi:hypothetical protein